ncbi:hypothetical protein AAC387_Pa02g1560 [Persea americana]
MDTQASTSGAQARRTRGTNRCIALTIQRESIVENACIAENGQKFDLGNNGNTKRRFYSGISHSWRNWKTTLKKKYFNPISYYSGAAAALSR